MGEATNEELIRRSRDGDHSAFAMWFERRRGLMTMELRKRLFGQFARRVDASDIVQDVFLDADRRLAEVNDHSLTIDTWIRLLLKQRLIDLQRQHIGADCRSVLRESPGASPGAADGNTSVHPLAHLVADTTSPSQNLLKAEQSNLIRFLIDGLPAPDREVLNLRHTKSLSNAQVAQQLGISVNAASNRYVRALRHLRAAIESLSHSI